MRTPAKVTIPVEFTQGNTVNVVICEDSPRQAPPGSLPHLHHYRDRPSKQWERLRPDQTWWKEVKAEIELPADHCRYDKKVEDTVIGVCVQNEMVIPASQHAMERKRPILVILESPHQHEYTPDAAFTPTGPLLKKGVRGRVWKHLPSLIRQAKAKARATRQPVREWEYMVGAEVVIVNPVPFQASLHRFLQRDYQKSSVSRSLCNQVWRALYTAKTDDGDSFMRDDFVKRITDFNPRLIINACTQDLREDVRRTLIDLEYDFITVSAHPSGWKSTTTVVDTRIRSLGPNAQRQR